MEVIHGDRNTEHGAVFPPRPPNPPPPPAAANIRERQISFHLTPSFNGPLEIEPFAYIAASPMMCRPEMSERYRRLTRLETKHGQN